MPKVLTVEEELRISMRKKPTRELWLLWNTLRVKEDSQIKEVVKEVLFERGQFTK